MWNRCGIVVESLWNRCGIVVALYSLIDSQISSARLTMRHDEVNQEADRRPPLLLLSPLFEAPSSQITEAPNHRGTEAVPSCLLLLSVPLDCEQEHESRCDSNSRRRLFGASKTAVGASCLEPQQCLEQETRCLKRMVLRCFGASVPRTGARAVVVVGLLVNLVVPHG
jgi:hypothetical protein